MARGLLPRWGRLPESGESSYCAILGGLDLKQWHKKYRHKPVRRSLHATNPKVACLRRYFLSRGCSVSKAETQTWGYPPGQIIRPKPQIFYTIQGFASFIDAAEASSYATVLKSYYGKSVAVLQTNRG